MVPLFFVDREPCFTLLYKLGDVKQTEKNIKQKKRRKMTPGGSDKTISDT